MTEEQEARWYFIKREVKKVATAAFLGGVAGSSHSLLWQDAPYWASGAVAVVVASLWLKDSYFITIDQRHLDWEEICREWEKKVKK